MNRSGFAVAALTLTIAFLAGCASQPSPSAPASAPRVVVHDVESDVAPVPQQTPYERKAEDDRASPTEEVRSEPISQPSAASGKDEPETRPAVVPGETAMLIVSEPAGGVVVIDGRPVGPAPVQVTVPVTDRGYLSRQMSVKVRFLAGVANAQSHTVELMLTPLDRVPARLDFTPGGARRTLGIK